MEDIPVKLRCAACNRLATNAFRTPCCDQSICESCQSSLPQACPICLHEPVKAEDCRPNKTLRMTIKAFLKKVATEREKAQKKQSFDKTGATKEPTPAESSGRPPTLALDAISATRIDRENDAAPTSQEALDIPPSADNSKPSTNGETLPTEAQMDVPQPSIEATEDRVREESFQEQAQGDGAAMNQTTQQDGSQQTQNQHNMQMHGMNGGGMGFEGMNNGFPSMAFNNPGDFNAMMQFMPNNAMGAFPNMMGMPGMGMDPMQAMSQGIFGGLGGQNMGMNGMNAGMGFPAGQGWNNGGFNGQPGAWMSGQDKFNQNAYGGGHANGMMGGDFGANAGYAGYNMPSHQGNFNQMNHHQFPNHDFQSNGYHGQGFHTRGRGGRGRGYGNAPRGRGGYNQVMNGNQTNHEPFHHQYPPQLDRRGNSFSQHPQHSQDPLRQNETENADVDDFGRTKRPQEQATDEQIARQMAPGDADDGSPEVQATVAPAEEPAPTTAKDGRPSDAVDVPAPTTDSAQHNPPIAQDSRDQRLEKEKPTPIETFMSDVPPEAEPSAPGSAIASTTMMPPPSPAISQPPFSAASSEAPYEHGYRGRGGDRRLSRGSSDFRGVGRGRGAPYIPNGNTNHVISPFQPNPVPVTAPTEPKGVGVVGAPKGPKAMREGLPNTGIRGGRGFSIVGRASVAVHARTSGPARSRSRSPTKSPSPSRHRSHHHRSHRHRSTSAASASPDREERRRERHRRRSRKYEDEDEEMQDDTKDSTTRRSSHRSSRRDREEDRDNEDHGKEHRSHRSRRDRDRDRDHDRDGEPRSTHKRSRTPNAAVEDTDGVGKGPKSSSSSRKRHERHEEDDEARRERKRSRREHHENHDRNPTNPMERSSKRTDSHGSKREDRNSVSSALKPPTGPKSHQSHQQQSKEQPPAIGDIDFHELERQARNKERLQKELQRREAMEGKGASTKHKRESKTNGGGATARRVNYKFEDELEGGNKVEREREEARWG
ncbi:MAG: hypothetical protein Q9178_007429 [Gyalolechia marmorata]